MLEDSGFKKMSSTIYITNFPLDTQEPELRALFSFCGPIKSTDFSSFPLCVSITFEYEGAVSTALLLDKAPLKDQAINITRTPPPCMEAPKPTPTNSQHTPITYAPTFPTVPTQISPASNFPTQSNSSYVSTPHLSSSTYLNQSTKFSPVPSPNSSVITNELFESSPLSSSLDDSTTEITIHTPGAVYLTGLTPAITDAQVNLILDLFLNLLSCWLFFGFVGTSEDLIATSNKMTHTYYFQALVMPN